MISQTSPRGLLRWFLRSPILAYRLGLGGLFGKRFLMMTHMGRISGRPRRVILEVVAHDTQTGAYVVASGWGEAANWKRNIERNPQVRVQVGWRKWPALARRLSQKEAEVALADYARRNPVALRLLAKRFHLEPGASEELPQTWLKLAALIPLFVLEPHAR